jgi:hypothetical protein
MNRKTSKLVLNNFICELEANLWIEINMYEICLCENQKGKLRQLRSQITTCNNKKILHKSMVQMKLPVRNYFLWSPTSF